MYSHLSYNQLNNYRINPLSQLQLVPENKISEDKQNIDVESVLPRIYTSVMDKDVVIYELLQKVGVFDDKGSFKVGLRSSDEANAPSDSILFYDPPKDSTLDYLLNMPKLLLNGVMPTKEFNVRSVLKSIYDFLLTKGYSKQNSSQCYRAFPKAMEIEIDSQTSWNIFHHDGCLKTLLDLVYPSPNSIGLRNIEYVLDIYSRQINNYHSIPCYTFYTSDNQLHDQLVKHLCRLFKESFPRVRIENFYRVRQQDSETVEVEFHFANGNVCFRFQTPNSFNCKTVNETFALCISNEIVDNSSENKDCGAVVKIRHDPEEFLLNRLCNKFTLLNGANTRCTLADLHHSDSILTSPEVEKELVLKVRNQWEDPSQLTKISFPLLEQEQSFHDFAFERGIVDRAVMKHAFYLLNLMVDHIEKHYWSSKEKNPAIARFVYSYCQSLQQAGQVSDVEIFLIWGYLKKLQWIRKSYQDQILHNIVQSILIEKQSFSVISATLLLSILQNAPSTLFRYREVSLFGVRRVVNLFVQGSICTAVRNLKSFLFFNTEFKAESLKKLHFIISQLFQGEPRSTTSLTPVEMSELEELIMNMLMHPNEDICTLGMYFAQIFADHRFDGICCNQIQRFLNKPDSPVLNSLYLHLVNYLPDQNPVISSSDWVLLLLKLHRQNNRCFDSAIFYLCQYDRDTVSTVYKVLLYDVCGKQKFWNLLVILGSNFEYNEDNVKRLISCLCLFFQMSNGDSVSKPFYPSRFCEILLKIISIPHLLDQVDPISRVPWIDFGTLQSYQNALIDYLINENRMQISDKQFLLFKCIVKSHITFSAIPSGYLNSVLTLLSPYFYANAQIGNPTETLLWKEFKKQKYAYENQKNTLFSENIIFREENKCTKRVIEIDNHLSEKFTLSFYEEDSYVHQLEEANARYLSPEDSLYEFGKNKFVSEGKWVGPKNVVPPLDEIQKNRAKAFFYSRHHIGSRNNPEKKSIDEWYRELNYQEFEINGGGAEWILGEEFYRKYLTNLNVPAHLISDKLFHRFRRLPNDFDTPVPADNKIKTVELIKPIFQSINKQFKQHKDSNYAEILVKKYWAAPPGHPVQMAIVAYDLFESKKVMVDSFGKSLKDKMFRLEILHRRDSIPRYHLNIGDALSFKITMKKNSICCELRSDLPDIELVMWHYICRRLDADNPENIDGRSAVTELALVTRSLSPVNKNFIPNLFQSANLTPYFFMTTLRKALLNHCAGGEDAYFAGVLNSAALIGGNLPEYAYGGVIFERMNKDSFLMKLFEASGKVEFSQIEFVQKVLNLWAYLGWGFNVSIYEKPSSKHIEFRCHYGNDFITVLAKDDLVQALDFLIRKNEWNCLEGFFRKWLTIGAIGGLPIKSISWDEVDILFMQRNSVAKKIAFMLRLKLYEQDPSILNKGKMDVFIKEMEKLWSLEESFHVKKMLYRQFLMEISPHVTGKSESFTEFSCQRIKNELFVLAKRLAVMPFIDEPYISELKTFNDTLNVASRFNILSRDEKENLGTNISKIIARLLGVDMHQAIFELIQQAYLNNILFSLGVFHVQKIVDFLLDAVPSSSNNILSLKNIYELMKNKLSYEQRVAQTRKDVPIFIKAFMRLGYSTHAVDVAKNVIEYHPVLKELAKYLINQSLWNEVEFFLKLNSIEIYQSNFAEEWWMLAIRTQQLDYTLTTFLEKIELFKTLYSTNELFQKIKDFVRLQEYSSNNPKNWMNLSALLDSLNIKACEEWLKVINGLNACGYSLAAEGFYRRLYA